MCYTWNHSPDTTCLGLPGRTAESSGHGLCQRGLSGAAVRPDSPRQVVFGIGIASTGRRYSLQASSPIFTFPDPPQHTTRSTHHIPKVPHLPTRMTLAPSSPSTSTDLLLHPSCADLRTPRGPRSATCSATRPVASCGSARLGWARVGRRRVCSEAVGVGQTEVNLTEGVEGEAEGRGAPCLGQAVSGWGGILLPRRSVHSPWSLKTMGI